MYDNVDVRIIKFVLPSGEIETLMTNLFDIDESKFKELYFKRWGLRTKSWTKGVHKTMYSYEQRKKAIKTYLQTQSVSETLRILGYPSSKELYKWIHEYQQNGKLHKKRVKSKRIYYTEEEKAAAVQFYHDNHGSYQDVADKLEYPSSAQLRLWVKAAEKEREKACEISPYMIPEFHFPVS